MHVSVKTAMVVAAVWVIQSSAATQAQTVWYVDASGDDAGGCSSWNDACPDLKTALGLADFGDQIWVAAGTYHPDSELPSRRDTFQLVSGVRLYGGFAGSESSLAERAGLFDQTVLSGDLGTLHVYNLVTAVGLASGTILDGFTITGGQAKGSVFVNDRGGAVFISNSTLTIRNCALIDNIASNVAGAVWMRESDVTIIDCRIEDNFVSPGNGGGAIHDVFGSHLTLINTVVRDNALAAGNTGGGAIFVGGNILHAKASSMIATNCVFVGNRASAGGAILNNGFAWLTNTLFIDNVAEGNGDGDFTGNGGAVANFGELTVTNCSFFNNTAVLGGAGLFNGFPPSNTRLDSLLVVSNTVLWGNSAPVDPESAQVFSEDDDLFVDYSCVEGLTGSLGGARNIGEDPLFVDAANGNLRLFDGSPCIDAADNFAVPEDVSTDLDGLPRFQNDPDTRNTGRPGGVHLTVDMGAYEFAAPSCLDDDDDGRVTICHVSRGHQGNPRTLTVPENAVPAHLAHGDTCGACQEDEVSELSAGWAHGILYRSKLRTGLGRDTKLGGVRSRSDRDRIPRPYRTLDLDADGDVEDEAQ